MNALCLSFGDPEASFIKLMYGSLEGFIDSIEDHAGASTLYKKQFQGCGVNREGGLLTVAVRCLKGLENCQKVGVRPTIGMAYEQAVATCWGKPETINRTITQGHVRVQAVYADHQHYLYFDDGVLTSIGESGAAP